MGGSSIDIIQELRKVLTSEQLALDPASLETYGQDWTRFATPAPTAIVFPRDNADVVAVVECARRYRFALVPSGGRTGLSGGACAAHGEIVVSMDKMNAISAVNLTDRTVTVGAGAITQNVQQVLKMQICFIRSTLHRVAQVKSVAILQRTPAVSMSFVTA